MSSRRPYGGRPASRIGSRYPVFRRCSLSSAAPTRPSRAACEAATSPGRSIQFRQHGRDVMVDGLGGDEQLGGDLGVCVAGADQVGYLLLTPRQAQRMGPRRGRGPAGIDRRPIWASSAGYPGRGRCPLAGKIFTALRYRAPRRYLAGPERPRRFGRAAPTPAPRPASPPRSPRRWFRQAKRLSHRCLEPRHHAGPSRQSRPLDRRRHPAHQEVRSIKPRHPAGRPQ